MLDLKMEKWGVGYDRDETEAGAETRQDMTRQGKTRQDDFAAYADAAARCCKNILGSRSINQATQMTEERTENTQTVRHRHSVGAP